LKSGDNGDANFVFLACDTVLAAPKLRPSHRSQTQAEAKAGPHYVDSGPLRVASKPEPREYQAVYISNDAETGLFSNEVVVNCTP